MLIWWHVGEICSIFLALWIQYWLERLSFSIQDVPLQWKVWRLLRSLDNLVHLKASEIGVHYSSVWRHPKTCMLGLTVLLDISYVEIIVRWQLLNILKSCLATFRCLCLDLIHVLNTRYCFFNKYLVLTFMVVTVSTYKGFRHWDWYLCNKLHLWSLWLGFL